MRVKSNPSKMLNAQPTLPRFRLLDALRGFSVLWIVCFHVMNQNAPHYGKILNGLIAHGYLGAQVFFVISGFCISMTAEKWMRSEGGAAGFLKTRLARIYLPYFFGLFFVAVVFPAFAALMAGLGGNWVPIAFFHYSAWDWIRIITLTKVFSAHSWHLSDAFPINPVIWYLAVTVQMYFVVALALSAKRNYLIVILAVTGISILCLIPWIKAFVPYGLFLPWWPQFACGILLFYIARSGRCLPAQWMEPSKYLFVFLILFVGLTAVGLYYFYSPTLFAFLVAVLCWLVYPLDQRMAEAKTIRLFSQLGVFSYSLYLMHPHLNRLAKLCLKHFKFLSSDAANPCFVIPAIIVLSYVWYLFFEKPKTVRGSVVALSKPLETFRNM